MTLRITGGIARGTRLFTPPGLEVRPALARMRVSLFEILKPELPGATVLDLFAGSGSLGFEALSRGAGFSVFLDVNPKCVEVLRRNSEKLRVQDRVAIRKANAFSCHSVLRAFRRSVRIVFIDPPYADYIEKREDLRKLLEGLAGSDITTEGAIFVVEHRPKDGFDEAVPSTILIDRRSYGGTIVTFYRRSRHA